MTYTDLMKRRRDEAKEALDAARNAAPFVPSEEQQAEILTLAKVYSNAVTAYRAALKDEADMIAAGYDPQAFQIDDPDTSAQDDDATAEAEDVDPLRFEYDAGYEASLSRAEAGPSPSPFYHDGPDLRGPGDLRFL